MEGSTAGAAVAPCAMPESKPCSSNRYTTSTAIAPAEILSRSKSRMVYTIAFQCHCGRRCRTK
jgi:hypothetical protein